MKLDENVEKELDEIVERFTKTTQGLEVKKKELTQEEAAKFKKEKADISNEWSKFLEDSEKK